VGPRAAGTLPHVERALLDALRAANLGPRVVRVAADTNGYITAAAVVLTYEPSGPDPLGALQTVVGELLRAAFAAAPCLDELDVTAFPRRPGPFDGNRRDAGFTAAASRREVEGAAPGAPSADLVRRLARVWVAPDFPRGRPPLLVLGSDPRADLAHRLAGIATRLVEGVSELPRRLAGMTRGGVVDGVVYRGRPGRRAVALTFDDGPEPLYTPLLLDTLDRLGLHATFFLVGHRVEQYPYFARAIRDRGHELASHGYSHVPLARLSPSQLAGELDQAQRVLQLHAGMRPALFRPPGGRYSPAVLRAAAQRGLVTVLWTDAPGDYGPLDPQKLLPRLLSRLYAGGILLLHQGTPGTLRLLPELDRTLHRLGYQVTTVSGLLERKTQ